MASPITPAPTPLPRLASIDAYRGVVMLLMMAEVLHLARVAKAAPATFWQLLADQQSHVPWRGCTLHDLIQPSFSFLVGVALPFSIASRIAKGHSTTRMIVHAAWRSLLLIALGVFLRSIGRDQTNFTFEDTLSQIGLGYLPLFALGFAKPLTRWVVFAILVIGYGGLFAAYPLPEADYHWPAVGVPIDWPHHPEGFAAHWDKNSNPAWAFDTRVLNWFPRKEAFTHNGGGYATLSFVPTLATMLLGLFAGTMLRDAPNLGRLLLEYLAIAAVLLAAGWALDHFNICPNVKRIWTPTWVLFSGGCCFAILALFVMTTDAIGYPGWSYPLRVIGANSILAYAGSHLIEDFVLGSFRTHLGADIFARPFGAMYEPVVAGAAVLAVYWLVLWWMYRNKLFVRI